MKGEIMDCNMLNFWEEKLIQFTKDLISIDSSKKEDGVAALIKKLALEHKLHVVECPVSNGRTDLVIRLVGSGEMTGFTGHMDTVPVTSLEVDEWKSDPYIPQIKDGKIYGRGSCDMKGGLAAALYALIAAASALNREPNRDIGVICTVDEEGWMSGSKQLIKEPYIKELTELIVCEPTELKCCTSGAGRTYGKVIVKGKGGHGSGHGKNVIHFATSLIGELLKERFTEYATPDFGESFWQILAIHAEKEPCVIPDYLSFIIDARLSQTTPTEKIWERLQQVLDRTMSRDNGFKVEIEKIDARDGWQLENKELSELVSTACKRSSIPYVESFFPGTTDGCIFKRCGIESVIIGPGNLKEAHSSNESLSIQQLKDAFLLYYNIIQSRL